MIYLNNIEKTIHKPAASHLDPVTPEEIKELTAQLFTVKRPENIYLTKSGAQAMELALRAFVGKGGHVITTKMEQEDTYQLLEELGAEVTCLDSDPYLRPNYDQLEGMIRPDTTAIVIAHGDSASGNVSDLERVCVIGRRYNIPVIADGRFTAGAVEVNLEAIGVDVYCFTGDKMLMGPDGIGGICIRENVDKTTLQSFLGMENGMANPEFLPEAKIVAAYAAAIRFILEKGIYGVAMLPHRLAKRFYESSKAMDGIKVHGDYGPGDRLPLVAITAEGFTAEEIQNYFKEQDIIIGVEKGLARFSFGYFNDRPQVKKTVQALMDMMGIDDPYLLP